MSSFAAKTIFIAALFVSHAASCSALASPKGGGGFGKATAQSKAKRRISTQEHIKPRVETINLGKGKQVDVFVPVDALNQQLKMAVGRAAPDLSKFYGTGDVIWPASLALARLVAHCPSFVNGRNVIELGCGLGLISSAVSKHTSPNHLALTDRDADVLKRAYESCTTLCKPSASVSRTLMDWQDPKSWPNQSYDVILASDVLYDAEGLDPLVSVLKSYLGGESSDGNMKRALIVDPIARLNRDAFCRAAEREDLDVDHAPFPGLEDEFVLINVTPLS